MRRGEVWLVDLESVRKAEANKRRPAVIVSNDVANQIAAQLRRGVVTVVPITSNVTRVYPFQVRLEASESGLRMESKAQAEQVRAVSVARLTSALGELRSDTMAAIDDALRLHLDL